MPLDESRVEAWRKMQDQNTAAAKGAPESPLFGGGGGGTSGGMETVDAKIAAAEARTDTKFAELRGALTHFATKSTVWGAVGTAVGITLAVLALGANRSDAGMATRSALDPVIGEQKTRDQAQDKKLDEILSRLPKAAPAPTPTPVPLK